MLRRLVMLAAAAALVFPAAGAIAAPVHQLRIYELNPAKTDVFMPVSATMPRGS